VLLLAIAVDAQGHTIPLAWGVVESEAVATWGWFLSHLITAIPRVRGRVVSPLTGQIRPPIVPIPGEPSQIVTMPPREYPPDRLTPVGNTTIISDRDKGLMTVIGDLAPGVNQAYCIRHLEQNVLGVTRGSQANFRCLSYAQTPLSHRGVFKRIAEEAPELSQYLANIHAKRWVLGVFPGARWGINTSNHAESTNASLLHPRGLPITHLIHAIWGYVQGLRARYGAQAIGAPPEHKFTPAITTYLEKVILGARACRVSPSDPRGELVVTRNEIEYRVDLGANSCSCPY
jgi:hypothetical protein